jgi:hypothetical protein
MKIRMYSRATTTVSARLAYRESLSGSEGIDSGRRFLDREIERICRVSEAPTDIVARYFVIREGIKLVRR